MSSRPRIQRNMRQPCVLLMVAALLAAAGLLPLYGQAVFPAPPVAPPPDSADEPPLTAEQLDELLSPIALYPDPLLAQILPAATSPQDIAAAQAWLTAGNNPNQIDDQPWDPAVLALARFPTVLKMLADYPDWTDELGYAFATQQADVAASIQRLRAQAQAAGSLVSTQEQEVVADAGGIQIVPANPQVIYVPVYDPQVVFLAPPPGMIRPRITFGPPLPVGIWLTNDFNWGGGYVVIGGGWRYRRGGVWVPINNRPAFWPRSWYRVRPGWNGRPQPWRPPPGRPPFRPPPRPPVIPGRPPPRPGFSGNRPGRPSGPPGRPGARPPTARPPTARPPGTNRPRPTDENRGRPGSGNPPAGRGGGQQSQRPSRPGGLGDIDRPGGGQANSNRGRQSRSGSSAQPPSGRGLSTDGSANSAARNSARGAQSRGQGGGGRGGGGGAGGGRGGGGSGGGRGGGGRGQ